MPFVRVKHISAVHQHFSILIRISTLPVQHTTFISNYKDELFTVRCTAIYIYIYININCVVVESCYKIILSENYEIGVFVSVIR